MANNNWGGLRANAGRKTTGRTARISCNIAPEARFKLQELAKRRNTSIVAVLEELILREG